VISEAHFNRAMRGVVCATTNSRSSLKPRSAEWEFVTSTRGAFTWNDREHSERFSANQPA